MEEIFVTSRYRLSLSPHQQQPPFIWPDAEWAIILPTSFTLFSLPPFPSSSSGGADGSVEESFCLFVLLLSCFRCVVCESVR